MPNKSSKKHAFFRAPPAKGEELLHNDAPVLLEIPYFVDHEIFWERSDQEKRTYEQPFRVAMYRRGLSPVRVEMPFERLRNF